MNLVRHISAIQHTILTVGVWLLWINATWAQSPVCGYLLQRKPVSFSQARSSDADEVLYIPVVFHIVTNQADLMVTDEQVYAQLQVINEDFSMTNTNAIATRTEFKSRAANVHLQFYIGNDQLQGQGITRTITTHGPFFNDDLHLTNKGGKDGWDSNKYLNVWIANLASGVFGYGATPGGPSFKDGVAIHYQCFGKGGTALAPYHLGRTLTHEIGHWLGLQHPWGTSGECLTDDGLSDTPPQSAPTFGCALDQVSCGRLTMIQNFMNTSYDECMTLFTIQQKEVMRQTLFTARAGAFSTTPPVVTAVNAYETETIPVLYPNPVTGIPVLHVRLAKESSVEVRITLMDMLGKEVACWTMHPISKECEVNVNGINNGMYVARIEEGEKKYAQKIYLNYN